MTTFNVKTKTSGKCRVYPNNPNGIAPSVTSITQILFKDALVQWAADTAVEYIKNHWAVSGGLWTQDEFVAAFTEARFAYKAVSTEAADRGTDVHAMCQDYLTSGRVSDDALFQAFKDWSVKCNIEPIAVEIELHGDGYSGRCDLIAYRDTKDGRRVKGLYDIKTGRGNYYPEWGLQLAAYSSAYGDLDEVGIIKLNKETNKCNFSEDTAVSAFTPRLKRLQSAWKHLVEFYWHYNDLYKQLGDIEDEIANTGHYEAGLCEEDGCDAGRTDGVAKAQPAA